MQGYYNGGGSIENIALGHAFAQGVYQVYRELPELTYETMMEVLNDEHE